MEIITKIELYEMMEIVLNSGYDEDVDVRDVIENIYGEVVDNWNEEYGRNNWEFEDYYRLDEDDFLNWLEGEEE